MVDPLGQSAFLGENRAVSTGFDDRETAASRRLCAAVALAMRPGPNAVLDLGCGTGEMLALLRSRLPTARLVGVDPVGEALRSAEALLDGDPGVILCETTAEELDDVERDLPSFDLAICHLNLALWSSPVAGLVSAARRLVPGGLIYAVDLARVQGQRRDKLLRRAQSEAERDYLARQIAVSFDLTQAQQISAEVVATAPELDLTVRCAAGGLAGHRFASPQAGRLWADPAVQTAVAGFDRPADGAADDDVIHWEITRG